MTKGKPKRALCMGFRRDGEACGNYAALGNTLCLYHDEDRRDELIEQSRRGGQQNSLTGELRRQQQTISTLEGLEAFYARVLTQVSNGELDGSAAGVALREIRTRIEAMRGRQELDGRLSAYERAESELCEMVEMVTLAGVPMSLDDLRKLPLKLNTFFGRRDHPWKAFRDGSLADALWLRLKCEVDTIGAPQRYACEPMPLKGGVRVEVWSQLQDNVDADTYQSNVDPGVWLANLLDITLDELHERCARWQKDWLNARK